MTFANGYIFPYLAAAVQSYPAFTGGPRKICLHTTNIGKAPTNLEPGPLLSNWVGGHGSSPQVWCDPWRKEVWQSTSLRNGGRAAYSGGTNVNTDGVCHIEINGWAEHTSMWPAEWLVWLGEEVIAPIAEFYEQDGWGVDLLNYKGTEDPRLTLAQFDNFGGLLQHLHLPNNEGRWDANLTGAQMAQIAIAALTSIKPAMEDDMFTDDDRKMVTALHNYIVHGHFTEKQLAPEMEKRTLILLAEIRKLPSVLVSQASGVAASAAAVAEAVVTRLKEQYNR